MSAKINEDWTVKQLCESRMMSVDDLKELLEGRDDYLKFRTSSKKDAWIMVVIAKGTLTRSDDKEVEVKVSTYHDVKWDEEKQPQEGRKLLVKGTKMKEDNYDSNSRGLRYWMIFEVRPDGKFTWAEEPVNDWKIPFKACEDDFKYQHIRDTNQSGEESTKLIIRKQTARMFQIRYTTCAGEDKKVPANVSDVPNGHKQYEDLQKNMESLSEEIENLGELEYTPFIIEMRGLYKKFFDLKRLDSFAI